MRALFIGLTLLSAAALPLTASADLVDNFTLTGNGNTYTWSLPANETYPDLPHLGLLDFSTSVTINNSTQVTEDVGFFTIYGPAGPDLSLPQIPDELYGPLVTDITSITPGNPGEVDLTFALGSFNLDDFHFGPGQPQPPTPYTLLITQQDTAATPEPAGLLLLATALLAAIPFLRRAAHP